MGSLGMNPDAIRSLVTYSKAISAAVKQKIGLSLPPIGSQLFAKERER
jgi:hypothetical protein